MAYQAPARLQQLDILAPSECQLHLYQEKASLRNGALNVLKCILSLSAVSVFRGLA